MSDTSEVLSTVVVQDRVSRQVLMVAHATAEAVELTRTTGWAHFYSRSRQRLWKKGETSGHTLSVVDIIEDCDVDALLYVVDREHPVCHRNTASCFGDGASIYPDPMVWLADLVEKRLSGPPDSQSYTQRLAVDLPRTAQKVGEEAVEVVVAAMRHDPEELTREIADLLYHLAVLMQIHAVTPQKVAAELLRRHDAVRPTT